MTGPTPGPATLPRLNLAEARDAELGEEIAEVLKQVERPRVNLGGSAPPGRAD